MTILAKEIENERSPKIFPKNLTKVVEPPENSELL